MAGPKVSLFERAVQRLAVALPDEVALQIRLRRPVHHEDLLLRALVEKGDACFDVGANVGKLALYLAHFTGPTGLVVAFEPVPPTFSRLCFELQRPGLGRRAPVLPLPYGLSDCDGAMEVVVPRGKWSLASLARQEAWTDWLGQGSTETVAFRCQFRSLDAAIADQDLPAPDLIKIDVEGAECLVLRGATRTLMRDAPPLVFLELFQPWARAFGFTAWDVLSPLVERGYSFLFACRRGLVEHSPSERTPVPPEFRDGYNVIAFHRETHEHRVRRVLKYKGGWGPLHIVTSIPVAND